MSSDNALIVKFCKGLDKLITEVENKDFSESEYSPDEVDAFLDRISGFLKQIKDEVTSIIKVSETTKNQYNTSEGTNINLKQQIANLTAELKYYKQEGYGNLKQAKDIDALQDITQELKKENKTIMSNLKDITDLLKQLSKDGKKN
ncbi:MAG: hypothetical protein Ta2E_06600 [Mycoplasmoidaceae bacterium]|nr:MAG: hypothetical protein Ta2E_06600 [Mycoplasmoidaceae bacterium]